MAQASTPSAVTGTTHKWVFPFEEGSADMRDLLGGKGAGCAGMTRAGQQLPPGMWEQTLAALEAIEKKTGKKLGDPADPLLVSVRSGARVSMPGMMDTVLNLGLNDRSVEGLARLTDNRRFAYDSYRRFIQMFGRIVQDIAPEAFDEVFEAAKTRAGAKQDTDLGAEQLKKIVAEFKQVVRRQTGRDFPADPLDQLSQAIEAVFRSWMGKRAVDY